MLRFSFLLFFVAAFLQANEVGLSEIACKKALAGSTEGRSLTKAFLDHLPPRIAKLYRGVLAEGAQFTKEDLPAVDEFATAVLRSFSENERKVVYQVLKWPEELSSRAEKAIRERAENPQYWSQDALAATLTFLRRSALVTGYTVLGGAAFYSVGNAIIEKNTEEERKKDFAPFYEEGFEENIQKKLHLSQGLRNLRKVFKVGDSVYERKLRTELVTGATYALYELESGSSPVRQIEVHEDKVRNVSSGYSVRLISENKETVEINYSNEDEVSEPRWGREIISPYRFLTIMAADRSVAKQLLPNLAPVKEVPQTDFDKKYSSHFKLETSGVAVIDTGIDYTRSDIVSRTLINTKEIPRNGMDDDGNGYVDDQVGIDFLSGYHDTHSRADDYHGTFVSDVATLGSSRVKVLPLKDDFGKGLKGDIRVALDYIHRWNNANPSKPIRVVNMSFGSAGQLNPDLIEAIKNNPEIVFVAAAGNSMNGIAGRHSFPAEYKFANVINVGAISEDGRLAFFSGSGQNVDVVDRGQALKLMGPDNKIESISGTSFAAPSIAGLVAQMVLLKPDITVSQIRKILDESSLGSALPAKELEGLEHEFRINSQHATRGPVDREKVFQAVLALDKN